MAGPEQVHEPAGRDRVGADPAGALERVRLRLETVEELPRGGEEAEWCRGRRRDRVFAF
jgi:hypothetical protein